MEVGRRSGQARGTPAGLGNARLAAAQDRREACVRVRARAVGYGRETAGPGCALNPERTWTTRAHTASPAQPAVHVKSPTQPSQRPARRNLHRLRRSPASPQSAGRPRCRPVRHRTVPSHATAPSPAGRNGRWEGRPARRPGRHGGPACQRSPLPHRRTAQRPRRRGAQAPPRHHGADRGSRRGARVRGRPRERRLRRRWQDPRRLTGSA